MRKFAPWILFALMAVGIGLAFGAPNAQIFENKELARIIFFHLPCAWGSTLFLILAPIFAFFALRTRSKVWDLRAEAAMEMGFLLGILALVTGMIFSDVQWGAPWNWDPRQTSFLLVLLIVGAYFALRAAYTDPEKRASNSSAYALAAVLPELFLIAVLPRMMLSLHPDVVRKGGFDGTYWSVIGLVSVSLLLTAGWAYRLRVRAGLLEAALEEWNANAKLGDRDDSAPTGVVRPVSLHMDGR